MKKNKEKKVTTYPQRLSGTMKLFLLMAILSGVVLGILWEKTNNASLTKAGLLSFFLIVVIMRYWILIDRFRLNKAKVDQADGDKIKPTTAWSHVYYKYIVSISLFTLFILTMVDVKNYEDKNDWITFVLSLLIVLGLGYKFAIFEYHFQKMYNFKLPKNLFVVE